MRIIVQRVSAATVTVDGREVGRCGYGYLLLVGVHRDDTEAIVAKAAEKVATLRVFGDEEGKMNCALIDVPSSDAPNGGYEYDVLAVSNFTVYGDARKNRRPSFTESAPYELGERLFNQFVRELQGRGISVQTGVFGADMRVSLVNDGPVTIVLDVP